MQLHQHRREFEEAGAKVIVISFETIQSTIGYLKDTSLQWPVLVDERKTLYQYFGMEKAGFWDIWGFKTWKAYLKELMRGRLPRRGEGDIQQRGGDVILDPECRIRLNFVGSGPGDRPDAEYLLKFLKETW